MRFMVDNFTGKDVEKLMKATEQDVLAILDAGEIHWIGFEIRTGFISNRLRTIEPLWSILRPTGKMIVTPSLTMPSRFKS